jgi:hypothetical protein
MNPRIARRVVIAVGSAAFTVFTTWYFGTEGARHPFVLVFIGVIAFSGALLLNTKPD